jgi:putative methyltransferase
MWVLKLYHEIKGQSRGQWSWLDPVFAGTGTQITQDDLIDQILEKQPDVLALSIYVWNRDRFYDLGKAIKERCPHITIIVGGPEVNGYHDAENFYKEYPWIDWCVFSAGEASFSRLLDHLAGYETVLSNTSNNQGLVSGHEIFMDSEFMKGSPLLKYADEIKNHVDQVKSVLDKDCHTVYVWETVKGCPYKCSFCDWTNSGISNKVRFWGKDAVVEEPIWKQELKLLFDWGFKEIYWTNPNMGQTELDEEIVDYWCYLKDQFPDGPTIPRPNMTKTQKDRGFRLYTKMVKHKVLERPCFAFQDLDPTVLENIDRPEIPWPEHKALIQKFIADVAPYTDFDNFSLIGELIWGLPGQTIDTWISTTQEILDTGLTPQWNHFQVLPSSPAAKLEYQQQYGMTVEKLYVAGTHGDYCTSTYSKDRKTWITGFLLGDLSAAIEDYYPGWLKNNLRLFVDYVKNSRWVEDTYQRFLLTKSVSIDGKFSPGRWARENIDLLAKELGIIDSNVEIAV